MRALAGAGDSGETNDSVRVPEAAIVGWPVGTIENAVDNGSLVKTNDDVIGIGSGSVDVKHYAK